MLESQLASTPDHARPMHMREEGGQEEVTETKGEKRKKRVKVKRVCLLFRL